LRYIFGGKDCLFFLQSFLCGKDRFFVGQMF
jgi:hypothetical protein